MSDFEQNENRYKHEMVIYWEEYLPEEIPGTNTWRLHLPHAMPGEIYSDEEFFEDNSPGTEISFKVEKTGLLGICRVLSLDKETREMIVEILD